MTSNVGINKAINNHLEERKKGNATVTGNYSGKKGAVQITTSLVLDVFNPEKGRKEPVHGASVSIGELKGAKAKLTKSFNHHVTGALQAGRVANLSHAGNKYNTVSEGIAGAIKNGKDANYFFFCSSKNGKNRILGTYAKQGAAISFSRVANQGVQAKNFQDQLTESLQQNGVPLGKISDLFFILDNHEVKHIKRTDINNLSSFGDIFTSNANIIRFERPNGSKLYFSLNKTAEGAYQFSGEAPGERVKDKILDLAEASGKVINGLARTVIEESSSTGGASGSSEGHVNVQDEEEIVPDLAGGHIDVPPEENADDFLIPPEFFGQDEEEIVLDLDEGHIDVQDEEMADLNGNNRNVAGAIGTSGGPLGLALSRGINNAFMSNLIKRGPLAAALSIGINDAFTGDKDDLEANLGTLRARSNLGPAELKETEVKAPNTETKEKNKDKAVSWFSGLSWRHAAYTGAALGVLYFAKQNISLAKGDSSSYLRGYKT
jgi:hypothetical protein